MLLNALDFPDLGSALLCAQHGDRVYIPAGITLEAPPDGWVVDKSIELLRLCGWVCEAWLATT